MSIKALLSAHRGRIYVFLADEAIGRQFLRDAEAEGFLFPDGVKPTERPASDLFAVNDDLTINYVGFVGHAAYQAASKIGDKPLVKIDYRTLLRGKLD